MRYLLSFILVLPLLYTGHSFALESWTDLPNMKKPRAEASVVMYQDDLYAFNGFGPKIDIEPSIEKFDSASSQWTLVGKTSVALGNAVTHNGLVLSGQDVWLVGGRIGDHPGKVSNKVWIYNIGTTKWRQGPTLPTPFAGGGAALVNNKIYLFGGIDANAQCDVDNHYVLNLANQAAGWQDISGTAAMPIARNHFATTVLGNIIYAIGGQHGHDNCPTKRGQDVDYVHSFNPATNKWTRLADLPTAQSHTEPGTFAYNNYIYSVGGEIGGKNVLRFDPQQNKWTTIHSLPERLLAPISRVINGKLIVAGGGAPTTLLPTNRVHSLVVSSAQTSSTESPTQDTSPAVTALITVEAEDYDIRTGSGLHDWVNTSLSGASQAAAMVTTPDNGALRANSNASPVLSYEISFEQAGVYYLWIRGWGDSNAKGEGSNDSLHAGLNGKLSTSADKIDAFPAGWNWSQHTRDRTAATLTIPSAGVHTVNLWMREDGLAIDKFILTNDQSFAPQGSGPDSTSNTSITNRAPTIDAGANATILLSDSYTLAGQISDDGLPDNAITINWSKTSGPGTATFSKANIPNAAVSFSAAGVYILKFEANDGQLQAVDTLEVVVNKPASDTSPPSTHQQISLEAENYDSIEGTDTHNWISSTLPDPSGHGAMVTAPNNGTLRHSAKESPMLSYLVNFNQTGKHYLWIRGWGDTNSQGEGRNDSVHAGLNGVLAGSADKIDQFPTGWHWSHSTRDRAIATLDIPSAGLHAVNLWMREDGFAVDKIIISTDPTFIPVGDEPTDFNQAEEDSGNLSDINNAPIANAGADTTIQLGQILSLAGVASDDNKPNASLNISWQKKSGVGTVTFGDTSLLNTTATFSAAGFYILRLNVNDGQLSDDDLIGINVTPGTAANPTTQIDAATAWKFLQTSNGSQVTARHEAGAVAAKGKIYVMGGRGNRPVESYDLITQKWTSHGRAPVDIHHFQPVYLNDKIYAIGAMVGSGYPQEKSVDSVYIYNVVTNKWTKGATIPVNRRRGSAAAVVFQNKIYIVGGNKLGHDGPSVNWLDEFDPATNQWKALANAPKARDHATAAVANGKLVLAAGRRSAYPNVFGDTEGATDIYNFATSKWSSADNIPTQRAGTMTVAFGSEVVVIGGESLRSGLAHNNVESFNVETGRWRKLQSLGEGRHSGGAAILDNKIHVISGNRIRGGGNESPIHETLDLPIN